MTELRQIPDDMLPRRSPDGELGPALIILLIVGAVLFGLYKAGRFFFVRQGVQQGGQIVNHDPPVQDDSKGVQDAGGGISTDGGSGDSVPVQNTSEQTEKDKKEELGAEFDSKVKLWGSRIVYAFGGSVASVMIPVFILTIFHNCGIDLLEKLGLSDGQCCLLLVVSFIVAVSWPWIYLIFVVA